MPQEVDAMKNALLAHVESKHLKAKPPQFEVGDIVDVRVESDGGGTGSGQPITVYGRVPAETTPVPGT